MAILASARDLFLTRTAPVLSSILIADRLNEENANKVASPNPLNTLLWDSGTAEALDYLFAEDARAFFDSSFVERQQAAVTHHNAAVDDYRFHVGSFGRIHQVGIDIVERYLIECVAIDQHQVGALALLNRANLFFHVQRACAADSRE